MFNFPSSRQLKTEHQELYFSNEHAYDFILINFKDAMYIVKSKGIFTSYWSISIFKSYNSNSKENYLVANVLF